MKTQYLCLPLMRPNSRSTTATTATKQSPTANRRVLSPSASFTEKLREAVFRLIMVTVLSKNNSTSKNNNNNTSTSSRLSKAEYHHDYHSQSVRSSYYVNDPYSGQAVADCIEFMKKNSASSSPFDLRFHHHEHDDDYNCEDIKGESSVVAEIIIPLPVM